MGLIRKAAIGVGGLLGIIVVAGAVGYGWAGSKSTTQLAETKEVHRVGFPIPFPLSDDERAAVRAEHEANKSAEPLTDSVFLVLATERAVARGKHYLSAYYACGECHGADFGGGEMVDDPAMGRLLGANLTMGKGSRTLAYTAADWDRMVRHGVKPNGTMTLMPSRDFFQMSDRELSDIVSYIRSLPPVDKEMPAVTLGPVGKVLVATGQFVFSAKMHPTDHVISHEANPPANVADATLGKHLAQTCSGCHGATFAGGKIVGGPPDWPPAANLTPTGLAGWTYEDFVVALREGKSKTGVMLLEPMAGMPKFAKNMTDIELQALWAFIKDLPPMETGK